MKDQTALVAMTCNNCGKKLGEIKIKEGTVAIKCDKCGTINVQETKPTPSVKERQ